MSSYDPRNVKLTFNGLPISGFVDDELIVVTPSMVLSTAYVSAEKPIRLCDIGPPPPLPPPDALSEEEAETVTLPRVEVRNALIPTGPDARPQDILEAIEWLDENADGSSRREELEAIRADLARDYLRRTGKKV